MSEQADGIDASASVPEGLAEQLVGQGKVSEVALTRPGGLLTGLTKQLLTTALNAEMTQAPEAHEHGGRPDSEPNTGDNIRNGSSGKTVRTEIGDAQIQVPRDRASTFEPVMVGKRERT